MPRNPQKNKNHKTLISKMHDKIKDGGALHEQLPTATTSDEIAGYVKFPEVAYTEIETGAHDAGVALKITDFQLPPTAELAEIASKVSDSRELIDYQAIDWNYKGDAFHNQWQSFRVKKNLLVDYEARYTYEDGGKYQIMIKVVDVFWNDTNKMTGVCLE